ncbi:unnamed protein product [Orchesella dallaii]|uniref:Uncharacterized protein n=1 Tax=Orchesella dallaii TaxID=48710 RepID=A0ABP1QW94_9HEXA
MLRDSARSSSLELECDAHVHAHPQQTSQYSRRRSGSGNPSGNPNIVHNGEENETQWFLLQTNGTISYRLNTHHHKDQRAAAAGENAIVIGSCEQKCDIHIQVSIYISLTRSALNVRKDY